MNKVNSLLAELDAEFGKQKKSKAVKTVTVRDLNKTFHQRNSTGTISDMLHASNMTVKSWAQEPGYIATRRITHVVHQHCKACCHSVSYVANVFTEFENQRLRARVHAPECILVDSFGFLLPSFTEEHHQDVEECVSCLNVGRIIDDLEIILTLDSKKVTQQQLQFGDHYKVPSNDKV